MVVKLQTIPYNISEFVFGISVPWMKSTYLCILPALGGYASSRWTFRQEPTLVFVQHVENHCVA